MATETKERTRKPRARAFEVVLGALNERMDIIKTLYRDEGMSPHLLRIDELLDELSRARALNGKEEAAE